MLSLTYEKSVGGVIFRRENGEIKYLLLHYKSGHWDFPKGHIEKGETEEMTLRREVKEETGITDLKIIPKFREEIHYFYKAKGEEREKRKKSGTKTNIIKKVIFYLAETKAKEVKISHEHQGHEWLGYNEAFERLSFDNYKRIIKNSRSYIA